ncbi:PDK1L kinase, partial [Sylvietta virens]|nr:PDK1L kinase [Sylvietta virens]
MAEEGSKYSILREVGRGSYGVVYEAVSNLTGRRVAVKRMRCHVPENAELALQELWALHSVRQRQRRRHENVIQLEECVLQSGRLFQPLEGRGPGHLLLVETCLKGRSCADPRSACCLWFVTEFCEGGTMNEFLLGRGPDARLNRSFMRQLSSAVAFLHRNRIVHRDLKADNILPLSGAGNVHLKRRRIQGLLRALSGAGNVHQRRIQKDLKVFSRSLVSPAWRREGPSEPPPGAGIVHLRRIQKPFRALPRSWESLCPAGTYVCQGQELIPLGEALLENPNLKLQIPLKNKESVPEDLCQLLHHMLAFNPKERLDASQLEVQIRQISYGKKRQRSGS